ncbi:hypothetical protein [Nonomuraea longicatena]|uniref:Uncharacterized protein n=1 Tax=Nonomuraea longicatena TaxID=83682 RepID=A0ABN1NMK4_9ACTN
MNDDAYLIAALRLASGDDPIPARVSRAARELYSLRVPDVVTADDVDTTVTWKVRSVSGDDGMRLLRFAAKEYVLDLEVSADDGLINVAGQVTPHPGAGSLVDVRTPSATASRGLSATGQFACAGLPPGWVHVICYRPGQPPLATRWLRVRP